MWSIEVRSRKSFEWSILESFTDIDKYLRIKDIIEKAIDNKNPYIDKARFITYFPTGGISIELYPSVSLSRQQGNTTHSHFSPRSVKYKGFKISGIRVR